MADEAKAATGLINTHAIRALWTDCDPAGVMFYGTYFRWMDECSYYLFRKAGLAWETCWREMGMLGIPLISAHCDFRSPVKFGDVVVAESRVGEWGRSSFTVIHRFRVGERLTAEGYEKRVWCTGDAADSATIKSIPIPGDIKALFGG